MAAPDTPPSAPPAPGRAADDAADRLRRLQAFTAALSAAVRMSDVAAVLFEQGLAQFGARAGGIVWLTAPGRLELVFGRGVSEPEFAELDAAARAGERLPIRDAIISRAPVWLESPEEIRARYPVLEPLRARRGETGCAVVPLVLGERTAGVIGFTFAQERRLADDERSFVEVMTRLSAHAFERARLFEAEGAARREAERAREVQRQLTAVVSHDLRTPLSAITLSARLLSRRPELAPETVRLVSRIEGSAARMSAILRDLLDLERTGQGLALSLRLEAVDLAAVARHALAELESAEGCDAIPLAVHGDVALEGDPGRLAQVVSNLVGNALQHGQGAPVLAELTGREDSVLLVVHNRGPPIDPALLPALFEPFRRGPRAGERDRPGSLGLGLFIVNEVVKAHGGRIEVTSDERGTAFAVTLPRRPPAA